MKTRLRRAKAELGLADPQYVSLPESGDQHNRESVTDRPVVELRDVIKIYKTGSVEVVALRGLDLEVGEGECVALVGPSGCGKTTLLNLVGGMDTPSAGSVRVKGMDLSVMNAEELSDYRAATVGIVFQFFNLVPELTAGENVELPMRILGMPREQREPRMAQLLEQVGLGERERHLPSELSGGEQQRVAIAAALANDPPIILADEPTGELDTESGGDVLRLLSDLSAKDEKTVLIATHDTRITNFADRVLRIMDGRILREEAIEPERAGIESPSEELERLRRRVTDLTDRLARIRDNLPKSLQNSGVLGLMRE